MQLLRTAIAAVVFLAPAFGDPIKLVVPFGNTSVPGNTTDGANSGALDLRIQIVYGRGQFLNAGITGPVLISALAYRAAPDEGSTTITAAAMTAYASTSPYAPNSNGGNTLLTDTFATNLGPDNTLVFSAAPVALSSPGCVGSAVCPFDLVFAFDVPFLYDPTQGFLLIDAFWTGVLQTGALDASDFSPRGGPIATLVGSLDSPTGEVLDLGGNITQFTVEAVPEPSSGVLLLGGLALVLLRNRIFRK
ncbi:MAG: PEP-CTERM sorting domain-containing protein [Bryobacterales bacterium]|nr:PEP-CTERM sorting domain-containing protein [Bryobacterales bacterium]